MKKYVLLLLLLGWCPAMFAQGISRQQQEKIRQKAEEMYEAYQLQGDFLLGIVDENGLLYSFALNQDILHNKPSDLTEDSPIYTASHTKAFTGTLLQALEDDQQLDLDETLADYFPELTFDERVDPATIRIKDLLNHTSGLMGLQLTWKSSFFGYEDFDELLASVNTDYRVDPSRVFRYSNTGPVIASLIVDKATGKSWKDQMDKYVFRPLEMDRTTCRISDYKTGEVRPAFYTNANQQAIQPALYKTDQSLSAAGGVISTVNDLSKWLQANITHDKKLLTSEASWKALHEPTTTQDRSFFTYKRYGYSLGWDLATYREDTILTRFGGWGAISFHASFIPAKRTGMIAYCSDERAWLLPHLLANYAYHLMAGEEEAELIFAKEKAQFEEAFNESDQSTALENLLPLTKENDGIIGHYTNAKGWPDIVIRKDESNYLMSWGQFSGPVYRDEDGDYVASLPILLRSFRIEEGVLHTGSLTYEKATNE